MRTGIIGQEKRIDDPWTDRVNAYSYGSILDGGALGQAKNTMLGGVIHRPAGYAHKKRGHPLKGKSRKKHLSMKKNR